ncbi:hypothetical protein Hdeb2414_s0005g00165841 [Helianthus debilis subsp. tardiflorus]
MSFCMWTIGKGSIINSGGTLVEKCCHFLDLKRKGSIVNHKDEIYDGKGASGTLDLCMF